MTTTVNGTVWNQAEVNFMADAFGAVSEDDSIQVEALMKSIKASGKFTKDTNKDCAHLLNLCGLENESKYPQHVPCYDSIYSKFPQIIQSFHMLCSTVFPLLTLTFL